MASYSNGVWTALNLATDQRRTDNNPYSGSEFVSQFPDKTAADFASTYPYKTAADFASDYPHVSASDYASTYPHRTAADYASSYPDKQATAYIAFRYNNETKKITKVTAPSATQPSAFDTKGGKIETIYYTINGSSSSSGIPNFIENKKKLNNATRDSGVDTAIQAARDYHATLHNNYNYNTGSHTTPGTKAYDRQTAANNYNATQNTNRQTAANAYNSTQDTNRQTAATNANTSIDSERQSAADTYNQNVVSYRDEAASRANELGQLAYNQNNALNTWSSNVIDWAKNTPTGTYTTNRDHIFSDVGIKGDLDALVKDVNDAAVNAGVTAPLDSDFINKTLDGIKDAYGGYYANERIESWDGAEDGGTYDLIGQFDVDYYVKEYGDSRGLNTAWENATKYGSSDNPLDPNNDLDVTARFLDKNNMAWYDYSTDGKSSGARGSEATATKASDEYTEKYSDLTDAEQQQIRDQIFGLTGEDEYGMKIEWAENILKPLEDETVSFLEGKVASVFGEKDLEQQDKFGALAQDVLRKSVDELKKQQTKEREMDIFRGLPGFNEVYGSNKQLVNSLLGDSGVGGYLGMMGLDTRKMEKDLEKGFENVTGIKTSNAEYNWTKWMNESLKPYYENLESIEGDRVDEEGNVITYDLTAEEGKKFVDKFVTDYITPRFNMSKSMSEFVSYLDTLDEDEQNIFQTQTAMNALKQKAELEAKKKFNALKSSTDESVFDVDYYFDPTTTLEGVSEKDLENNYMNVQATKEKYKAQKAAVNRDWAAAKADGTSKVGIPEIAQKYNWEQWAYFYGADINDKADFAKLHYQVAGQGKYDPAKDIVSYDTVTTFFDDVLLPMVAEEKLSLDDAAFMQFVTPEEFATEILKGIDPTENKEEWKKVLEQFGIDDLDSSLEEVKQYIKEAFETGEAQAIREGIKYLNEKKEDISQETLGVDYIERNPKEILGEKGDIEVGSEAWKDLMTSYNLSADLSYEEATAALLNIEDIEEPTTNPLYKVFKGSGYAGTEEEFYTEFFPDASKEELADLNFVGRALEGDMKLTNIDSDPFVAMAQFEGFMGGTEGDLYGIKDEDEEAVDKTSYFSLFPEEEKYASDTGREIIDSWTGGLFG